MTETPHRVQRKRAKGWRMPADTVYVGRPSKWGNPYSAPWHTRLANVEAYRQWLRLAPNDDSCFGRPPSLDILRSELRGKHLACWCPLDQPCHADVLLEIANS